VSSFCTNFQVFKITALGLAALWKRYEFTTS